MITSPANPVSAISVKDIWRVCYGRAGQLGKVLGGNDKGVNWSPSRVRSTASNMRCARWSSRTAISASPCRASIPTAKLEEAIALDPAGLGVSTLSNTAGNPKLKLLNVEGVVPSTASVRNGSYPLYTPVYIAVREDSTNAAAVKDFIAWLDTPLGESDVDQTPARTVLRKASRSRTATKRVSR